MQLLEQNMVAFPRTSNSQMDTTDGHQATAPTVGISGTIVQLCVQVMVECVNIEAVPEGQDKIILQDLINSMDFECVLCTG